MRLGAFLLVGLTACGASGQMLCKRDAITGSEFCQPAGSRVGDAAAVTGTAVAVYAVTGCTVNGCELPNRCNPKTKLCEPITCRETSTCPSGYSCNMVTLLCR